MLARFKAVTKYDGVFGLVTKVALYAPKLSKLSSTWKFVADHIIASGKWHVAWWRLMIAAKVICSMG